MFLCVNIHCYSTGSDSGHGIAKLVRIHPENRLMLIFLIIKFQSGFWLVTQDVRLFASYVFPRFRKEPLSLVSPGSSHYRMDLFCWYRYSTYRTLHILTRSIHTVCLRRQAYWGRMFNLLPGYQVTILKSYSQPVNYGIFAGVVCQLLRYLSYGLVDYCTVLCSASPF